MGLYNSSRIDFFGSIAVDPGWVFELTAGNSVYTRATLLGVGAVGCCGTKVGRGASKIGVTGLMRMRLVSLTGLLGDSILLAVEMIGLLVTSLRVGIWGATGV